MTFVGLNWVNPILQGWGNICPQYYIYFYMEDDSIPPEESIPTRYKLK